MGSEMPFDPATRWLLLATLAIALLPLLLQLPPGVALAIAAAAAAIAAASWNRRLHGLVKLAIAFGVVFAVLWSFGFRLGRDTGSALLAAMLAIKPAETRSLRDARSLVGFALFAPFATFLLDQGPVSLGLGLAATACSLLAMQRLADLDSDIVPRAPWAGLRGIGRLLALGLPLVLAAFWLFPRIPTPLWGVPDRARSSTGLSDSMAPGDWLELLSDESPALRVRFFGATPPRSQMYWRGPVLWDFDGRSWRDERPQSARAADATPASTAWRYELEVEASERRYLTALDLPLAAPAGARSTPDGHLLSEQRLHAVTRWSLQSAVPARFDAVLAPAQRRRALAFPRDYNPRAQHLAQRWHTETGGDAGAVVARALALINAEFAYSLAAPALGRDSVDDFLFRTRVGYCEHFSSAFVFLMRAAGVPARVVTGYAGGYFNPVGAYWVVRNSDAHAWAEVWLAGRGWVRVDPTAAVAPERVFDTVADRRPGMIGDFSGFARAWDVTDYLRRGWNDYVLGFNAERQSRLLRWLGVQRLSSGTLVALFALVALLALGWMLWWLRRGEHERDPLLRAWHRLSNRYRRLGLPREPHETALDWAQRIARARPHEAAALTRLALRFSDRRYARSSDDALIRDMDAFRPRG